MEQPGEHRPQQYENSRDARKKAERADEHVLGLKTDVIQQHAHRMPEAFTAALFHEFLCRFNAVPPLCFLFEASNIMAQSAAACKRAFAILAKISRFIEILQM